MDVWNLWFLTLQIFLCFIASMDVDDMVFVYGGALGQHTEIIDTKDKELNEAVEFSQDFVRTRNKLLQKPPIYGSSFKIINPVKVTLVYTPDDEHPLLIQTATSSNRRRTISEMPLELGVTFRFSLRFPNQTHDFSITQYPPKDFHIYTHTVYDNSRELLSPCKDKSISKVTEETEILKSDWSKMPMTHCELRSGYASCSEGLPHRTDGRGLHEATQGSRSLYSEGANRNLRVMTYNIWNFNAVEGGEYTWRFQHMAKLIQTSGADIIGLQEVRFAHGWGAFLGPNQVNQFANALPDYQFVYESAQVQLNTPEDGRTEEGLAIFSRFPIVSHDFILLQRNRSEPADSHQRICLHAEIQISAQQTIHMFVTHLSLNRVAREMTVVQIWAYMNKFSGPAVLLGDFNAASNEPSVRFLRGEVKFHDTQTVGLADTWVTMHKDDPGHTYNRLKEKMKKRLDYIFLRKSPNVSLLDVKLVDDGFKQLESSSDHMAVIATLHITDDEKMET